jgi:DNA-binding MarR family transcriptional regulator
MCAHRKRVKFTQAPATEKDACNGAFLLAACRMRRRPPGLRFLRPVRPPFAATATAAMPFATDTPPANLLAIELYDQPGHLIRRAQQIAVSVFYEEVGREVTPIQYAVLRMLQEKPGLDQVTLAQEVALDTSTAAEIAARLENKGWIVREVLPRRQRRLLLTAEGEAVLARTVPGVRRMQQVLLSNLDAAEQQEFLRLLRKFVHLGNDQSRAPLRCAPGTDEAPAPRE